MDRPLYDARLYRFEHFRSEVMFFLLEVHFFFPFVPPWILATIDECVQFPAAKEEKLMINQALSKHCIFYGKFEKSTRSNPVTYVFFYSP